MAEVIVLVTPAASAAPRPGSAAARAASRATIDEWRASHPDRLLSAEEIDTQLAEERASWGDDG
ncbi:MAG: hypothetical protein EXR72_05460 [Myxococcales bacterium]|nr:hypothetical protein [Myxococcales bacterium]